MSVGEQAKIRGFTVVELLAVISIIIILGILLFNAFQGMLQKAKGLKCLSNLCALYQGIQTYSADSNGSLPPSYFNDGILTARYWYDYLSDGPVLNYKNNGVLPNPNLGSNSPFLLTVYNCPSNPSRISYWRDPSYCYNRALGYVNASSPTGFSKLVKISDLDQPLSKIVMLTDSNIKTAFNSAYPQNGPSTTLYYGTRAVDWSTTVNFNLHAGGRANFLLADGHAESIALADALYRFNNKTLLWTRNNDQSDANSVW